MALINKEDDQYWANLDSAIDAQYSPESRLSPYITQDPIWPKLKAAREQGASYDDLNNILSHTGRTDLVDALRGLEFQPAEIASRTAVRDAGQPKFASLLPESVGSLNRAESPEAYAKDNQQKTADNELTLLTDEELIARRNELRGGASPPNTSPQTTEELLLRREELDPAPPLPATEEDLDNASMGNRFIRGLGSYKRGVQEYFDYGGLAPGTMAGDMYSYSQGKPPSIVAQEASIRAADAKAERESIKRGQRALASEASAEYEEDPTALNYIDSAIQGTGDWDVAGTIGSALPAALIAMGTRNPRALAGIGGADGLLMPTETQTPETFQRSKEAQVLTATLAGRYGDSVVKGAADGLRWAGNAIIPQPKKALDTMVKSLFPNTKSADAVAKALREQNVLAPGNTPVAELMVDAQSPSLVKLGESMDSLTIEAQMWAAEKAAARAAIQQQALEAEAAKEVAAVAARAAETDPLRVAAIDGARDAQEEIVALDKSVVAAQARVDRVNPDPDAWRQGQGQLPEGAVDPEALIAAQRISAATQARFAQTADPITPEKLTRALDRFSVADPQRIGAGVAGKVAALRKRLLSLDPKGKGYIDPASLYTLRKEIQSGKFNYAEGDSTTSTFIDGDLRRELVKLLDDTISNAAGRGSTIWRNYLSAHAELSVPVNQARVFGELSDTLSNPLSRSTPNTGALVRAVDDPEQILKRAGARAEPTGNVSEVLNEQQMVTLNSVVDDVLTTAEAKRLAKLAPGTNAENLSSEDAIKVGNALIREIMVLNNVLGRSKGWQNDQVIKRLTDLFTQDPKTGYAALADLIENVAGEKSLAPAAIAQMAALQKVGDVALRLGAETGKSAARQQTAGHAARLIQ